jgi:hypothetical protein
MRLAIVPDELAPDGLAPDGLAPDGLASDVGVGVEVDVSELFDANKPGRNLYAPNAIKPRATIKKMGGGLFLWLVSRDIIFSPYIIYTDSTEKLLTTISIQELSVKVNSLNSLIKFIKVIFVFLGRAGCLPHKGLIKIGCLAEQSTFRIQMVFPNHR